MSQTAFVSEFAVAKYAAVFGRQPGVVREPTATWGVAACMFPPMKRSFWRGLISEAHDQTVYITAGMSLHPMPVEETYKRVYPSRVELMATCETPIAGGPTGKEDIPTAVLQLVADYVLDTKILIGVGHTLDFQQKLSPNTEMSAVLFALPVGVDVKRIRRCTSAQEILAVVPITGAELAYVRSQGVEALLDRFEEAHVRAEFDCFRKSAVSNRVA